MNIVTGLKVVAKGVAPGWWGGAWRHTFAGFDAEVRVTNLADGLDAKAACL